MNTKLKQRREFIKLASGLLVTPFASLVGGSAMAADDKPPLRMLTVIDTYGLPTTTRNEVWVKSTAGDYALADDDLGTVLSPLKAYKDNMLIASGINLDSLTQTGNSRTHHFITTHTLAASRNVSGKDATAKINHASIDVHVGQYLNNDHGLARAYPHLFFTTFSQPDDTTFCYDESGNQIRSIAAKNQATSIFGNVDNIADLQFQNRTQQSVFDLVQKQVQSLRGQLNNANAATVMEAYHSSVDDLAAQIQLSSANVCGVPGGVDSLPGSLTQSTDSTPYIFKNIHQAFACDLTSSLTFAIGGEKINQLKHTNLYDENKDGHTNGVKSLLGKNMHAMSHLTTFAANKSHEVVRIHQAEELATLLDNMSNTQDTDGNTLLDNTVIFWTSAMSHNQHKVQDYPYLLIAGKNTNLKGGFHYDCAGSTNNDLLTTIAQGMGLPDDRFGGHNNKGVYLNALQNGPISKMLKS